MFKHPESLQWDVSNVFLTMSKSSRRNLRCPEGAALYLNTAPSTPWNSTSKSEPPSALLGTGKFIPPFVEGMNPPSMLALHGEKIHLPMLLDEPHQKAITSPHASGSGDGQQHHLRGKLWPACSERALASTQLTTSYRSHCIGFSLLTTLPPEQHHPQYIYSHNPLKCSIVAILTDLMEGELHAMVCCLQAGRCHLFPQAGLALPLALLTGPAF